MPVNVHTERYAEWKVCMLETGHTGKVDMLEGMHTGKVDILETRHDGKSTYWRLDMLETRHAGKSGESRHAGESTYWRLYAGACSAGDCCGREVAAQSLQQHLNTISSVCLSRGRSRSCDCEQLALCDEREIRDQPGTQAGHAATTWTALCPPPQSSIGACIEYLKLGLDMNDSNHPVSG